MIGWGFNMRGTIDLRRNNLKKSSTSSVPKPATTNLNVVMNLCLTSVRSLDTWQRNVFQGRR